MNIPTNPYKYGMSVLNRKTKREIRNRGSELP